MPRMVEELTGAEQELKAAIEDCYSVEEQCAYYLTKTIRSIYQMSDKQVREWRDELRQVWQEQKKQPFPYDDLAPRPAIVLAYSSVLMVDGMYEFHLDYWLRHYQERLAREIGEFLSGLPPHLTEEWVPA